MSLLKKHCCPGGEAGSQSKECVSNRVNRDIHSGLSHLHSTSDAMNSAINELEGRLSFILRRNTAGDTLSGPIDSVISLESEAVLVLDDLDSKFNAHIERISAILNRLSL